MATVSILGGSTQWLETGKAADLICAATGSELVDRMHWVKVDGALPNSAEEKEPGILHFTTFRVREGLRGAFHRALSLAYRATTLVHGGGREEVNYECRILLCIKRFFYPDTFAAAVVRQWRL